MSLRVGWRRAGIMLLLLGLAVAALLGWLLYTASGRDLLLRQAVAQLPAGSTLT